MLVIALVAIGVLVLVVGLMVGLRHYGQDEARTETRLHAPGTHTLSYEVPVGQDAAVLTSALHHEGFTSITEMAHGTERVLIDASEQDRSRVRSIIEHVDRYGFDGPPMHVGQVRFQDER